jgi:hypothetical protein
MSGIGKLGLSGLKWVIQKKSSFAQAARWVIPRRIKHLPGQLRMDGRYAAVYRMAMAVERFCDIQLHLGTEPTLRARSPDKIRPQPRPRPQAQVPPQAQPQVPPQAQPQPQVPPQPQVQVQAPALQLPAQQVPPQIPSPPAPAPARQLAAQGGLSGAPKLNLPAEALPADPLQLNSIRDRHRTNLQPIDITVQADDLDPVPPQSQ